MDLATHVLEQMSQINHQASFSQLIATLCPPSVMDSIMLSASLKRLMCHVTSEVCTHNHSWLCPHSISHVHTHSQQTVDLSILLYKIHGSAYGHETTYIHSALPFWCMKHVIVSALDILHSITHTHTHYQHTTGPSVLLYKTHSSAYGHETMYSTTACIAQVIHSESFNIAPSFSGPNTNITIITWPICGCCHIAYAHFNVVLLKEWAWIGIDCWCLMVFSYSPFHSVPLHLFNFVYSLWKLSCHQWPFLDVEC